MTNNHIITWDLVIRYRRTKVTDVWLQMSPGRKHWQVCQDIIVRRSQRSPALLVVWSRPSGSGCVGPNGGAVVFNEGALYRCATAYPALDGKSSKAFTCLKYRTYQLPLPCSLQTFRCWGKTMTCSGTAYPGSYRAERYRGCCGGDTNQNEIFAAQIKCPG